MKGEEKLPTAIFKNRQVKMEEEEVKKTTWKRWFVMEWKPIGKSKNQSVGSTIQARDKNTWEVKDYNLTSTYRGQKLSCMR